MDDQQNSQILELAKKFEGREVHVFTINGANLRGRAHFEGEWVYVKDTSVPGKSAMCNMSHIISITKG